MFSAMLLALASVTAFFLGMFFKKAQDNSKTLKNMDRYNKEVEKINAQSDTRSDIEVLKKK